MVRAIGIRDVAKEAGVSTTTVSRVLNDRGYISESTRKKVHQAMKKLNYYPNDLARALFTKKTNTVGLIFPSVTNPFHAELIQAIEHNLAKKGYKVLLCNSLNDTVHETEYLTMLQKNKVDGIITGTHNKNVKQYDIPDLPIVAIDRSLGKHTTTVSCDNIEGAKIAVNLLVNSGCENILCIRSDSKIKMPGNSRALTYEQIMDSRNLPKYILEVPFVSEVARKKELVSKFLSDNPQIDGIFAGDDLLACIALNFAENIGKQVPKDIKIVGFDGALQTRIYLPRLTTICQPIEQIAEVATIKLLNKINGVEDNEDVIDLPVSLIRGATV